MENKENSAPTDEVLFLKSKPSNLLNKSSFLPDLKPSVKSTDTSDIDSENDDPFTLEVEVDEEISVTIRSITYRQYLLHFLFFNF